MQSPFSPGELVRARGRTWHLRDVTEHTDCVTLGLSPSLVTAAADAVALIHPFDRIDRAGPGRPALASRRGFWQSLAARLVTLRTCDGLIAPASAALDILPFQLEPAIAAILNGTARLLLADAVGLGKTIQAGLVVAELQARGQRPRVLVLVPAALRDQWRGELKTRFGIDADIVDAAALRVFHQNVPGTLNPWTIPRVAVVSIDFAKRPDVRPALADAPWDVVVIDEAHTVALDSDRRHAADQIAGRADRVILVTATPHSGDDGRFAALTRLGAAFADEPLTVFRRSRHDVGIPSTRRVRLLRVRLSQAEMALLRLVSAYLRAIWSHSSVAGRGPARLVSVLLLKRALSTPGALARSVARRRALLSGTVRTSETQLVLPLDEDDGVDDDEPGGLLAAPGLDSVRRELAWLDQIAAAAEHAVRESRKLRAVERLIRRAHEPLIVFTEFRDTLVEVEHVARRSRTCALLHGGLDRTERRAALESFSAGQADVLLATDAAGAGLNLHQRCRTVLNLELPWNPVRLEQRAGRVDRIGQARSVHALHLVARATAEERVLARLAVRSGRARAALADRDATWFHLPPADDETVAAACLGIAAHAPRQHAGSAATATAHTPAHVNRPELGAAGRREADRSLRHRRLITVPGPYGTDTPPDRAPCVWIRAGRKDRRRGAGPVLARSPRTALAIFEVHIADSQQRLVDESLIAVGLRLSGARATPFARRRLARLAAGLANHPQVAAALASEVRRRLGVVSAWWPGPHSDISRRREARLERWKREHGDAPLYQAGLFDRRAERAAEEARNEPAPRGGDSDRGRGGVFTLAREPRLGWLWWPGGI